MDQEDEIIRRIPIHYSNRLCLQLHQFPLLNRPLQTPPSAQSSGKRITARIKPQSRIQEIHVPADTRPEVWNSERGHEFGKGQLDDDREKNQERKGKGREEEEPRLAEIRMRSEEIPQQGVQMIGVLHNDELHLHPIDSTHQFRPTLTYLDILSRKNKRRKDDDSDSDSDDGPPPDPDEPTPVFAPKKKEKKASGVEAKEVQVSARRGADDKAGNLSQLSNAKREMLAIIRAEQDESWQSLDFCGIEAEESAHALDQFWSNKHEELHCSTDITTFLRKKK